MSKKNKLQDIRRRLRAWADDYVDGELDELLTELDGEISTMDDEPPLPDVENHPKKPGNEGAY